MIKFYNHFFIFTLFFIVTIFPNVSIGSGFSTVQVGPKPIWNATFADKLKQDLLLNYDKFARPTQHYNKTHVKIGLSITHIEVNEQKSTISVNAWLQLFWNDEKLKWKPENYGGMKKINLADHEIWQPDIMLYNSANPSIHFGGTHCIVNSTGEIIWVPPGIFNALCEFNLQYWPFDTQNCILKFGSWTHSGDEIDLKIAENKVQLDYLIVGNSEWDIIKATGEKNVKYYTCCKEPYHDVTFSLTLARKSPSYKALIITPAIVIILLTLIPFLLPPYMGEKILINGTTTIIISIFMLYFTQKLPAMGSTVPSVVSFYSASLYLVCFSTIISVIVLWLSRGKHYGFLPRKLKNILIGPLGISILRIKNYTQEASRSERVQIEELREQHTTEFEEHINSHDEHRMIKSEKQSAHKDWVLLAAAIDRISFIVFGFIFIILALVYAI